jgi:hypothetical protein
MTSIAHTQNLRPERPSIFRLGIVINLITILIIFFLIDHPLITSHTSPVTILGVGVQAVPLPIAIHNTASLPLPLLKPHGGLGFELEVVDKPSGSDESLVSTPSSNLGDEDQIRSGMGVRSRAITARENIIDEFATVESRNDDQGESSYYSARGPIDSEVDNHERMYQEERSFKDKKADDDLDARRKERLWRILPLRLRFRMSKI